MLVEMKVTTTLMLKTRVMLAKEELKHGDHKDASKKHTREEMHREIVRARDNRIFFCGIGGLASSSSPRCGSHQVHYHLP